MGRFPRAVNKQASTDFSFADSYIEERRTGKWRRIEVSFPLSDDRGASNIDYASEEMRRTYRGVIPNPGPDYNNLEVREPLNLASSKYRFLSPAVNGSNVPEGFYGTSSGIEPIVEPPFSEFYGLPTDNPVIVDKDFENTLTSGAEFIVAKNTAYSNPLGENDYIPNDPDSIAAGRLNWEINPNYQAPTSPNVRFPMGARKRAFFKS